MSDDRVLARDEFGFDEQVAERLMCSISTVGVQHDLRITRQLDLAYAWRMVGQGNAPHFRVVLRGNDHFHAGRDARVEPAKISFILGERYVVSLRLSFHRLMPGGPDGAAAHVAQVNEGAPVVARHVLAPAGDGKLLAV